MAFLRSLKKTCDRCRNRQATEELLTWRNDLFGYYCTPCSKVKLREVQADERATAARITGGAS